MEIIIDDGLSESGFYWREKNGVKVLICKELEKTGFVNGFSTRGGGVSPFPKDALNLAGFGDDSDENIAENRSRFLSVFGGDYKLTSVWQVHGDGVKIVRTQDDADQTEDKYDALVSGLDGILAGVKTADCVPILIGDPTSGAFAAVHAGWRGTVEMIAQKAINTMISEYRSNPADLICAIGPAAGCERYEIGQDVIDAFESKISTSGKLLKETRKGHALIDLSLANREQLIEAGMNETSIFTSPFCTMERNDLFFSYRIENRLFGKTGRLMSVIGRRKKEGV